MSAYLACQREDIQQVTWIRDRKELERCTRARYPPRIVSNTYTKIIYDALLCYYYNNKAGREVIVNFTCFSSSGNIQFFTIQQRSFSLVATVHVSKPYDNNIGTLMLSGSSTDRSRWTAVSNILVLLMGNLKDKTKQLTGIK